MRTTRAVVLAVGIGVLAYGAWLLWMRPIPQLEAMVVWVIGGVLLHDFVLAPLVIVICLVGARLTPAAARGPVTAGLIVLGTVSVLAIPVLGRFGARPDNATLLDRNYGVGWLVFAGLTVLVVAVMVTVAIRRDNKLSRTAGSTRSSGTDGEESSGTRISR